MCKLVETVPLDLLCILRACVRAETETRPHRREIDLGYLGTVLDKPDQLQCDPPNLHGLFASLIREDGSDEITPETERAWSWLA